MTFFDFIDIPFSNNIEEYYFGDVKNISRTSFIQQDKSSNKNNRREDDVILIYIGINFSSMKEVFDILKDNKEAKKKFIIFDINAENISLIIRTFYILRCFVLLILLKRNPLFFCKREGKINALSLINRLPSELMVNNIKYFLKRIFCMINADVIIIEY